MQGVFQALLWANQSQNEVCPWQLFKKLEKLFWEKYPKHWKNRNRNHLLEPAKVTIMRVYPEREGYLSTPPGKDPSQFPVDKILLRYHPRHHHHHLQTDTRLDGHIPKRESVYPCPIEP